MSDSAGMNATTPNHGSDDLPSIGRFPAYPAYRDSGVPWLGQVPAHWEVKRLKDIGTLVGGARFPHEEQGREGEELPFYKVADLARAEDGRTMGDAKSTISRETASRLRARIIPANSIVYAKIGAALLLNRRRITTKPCCIDNNMTAFTPALKWLSTLWAWYWLSIIDFEQVANPGAVPSFSEGDQASLPIALPDLNEQRVITAFLDRECGKMDALVAEQERLIALLKEKRQAVISHAVTKGLNPIEPMKESGIALLGQVPAAWSVARLKHALAKIGSGGTPDTANADYWSERDNGTPWITISDMSSTEYVTKTEKQITDLAIAEERLTIWPSGTLLFSMYASLGHVARIGVPATINQAILALVPNERIDQDFLKRWLEFLQPRLREYANRNTQDNLNAEKVKKLPCVFPPLHEQRAIAAFLDSECGRIDALIAEAETMISLLRERRSALISAAVTGQIDVRILSGPS
jgi:type I restriction enzyme S subunit